MTPTVNADSPVEMFLSLFLLNLQGKSRTKNPLRNIFTINRLYNITAGSAKKEMANTVTEKVNSFSRSVGHQKSHKDDRPEKHEATILPIQVLGTVSPYPIVVTVIWSNLDL